MANAASGSVGPRAQQEAQAILESLKIQGRFHDPVEHGLEAALHAALADRPDLLVVIAGDGTARFAAELAGPNGPLVAPLPGGTMNMLPHALYGQRDWRSALRLALEEGVERKVGGGKVGDRSFFVAAIFGSPALWAQAREAARKKRPLLAWREARAALSRAFTGALRYSLDGKPRFKAEALTLMCPLVSAAMDNDEKALEAAAIDPEGAAAVFRLGFRTLTGSWRDDPSVNMGRCKSAKIWASGRIPAILDGEPVRLGHAVEVRYRPAAFRALALPPDKLTVSGPGTP